METCEEICLITPEVVRELSIRLGVPVPSIEKDYVMGWLLWGINNVPSLNNNLVLKGGNSLRKIYFPDTRFSDDLDFTAIQLDTETMFHDRLDAICNAVADSSGIEFDFSRTIVEEKSTPDKDCRALDG